MKKVLFMAIIAIASTTVSFAQPTAPSADPVLSWEGWKNIPVSFASGMKEGTAYLFNCPVSKDANGALSVNVAGAMKVYVQTPNGPQAIVAKLNGALPSNWAAFAHPNYGAWVRNPDGSQWFRLQKPLPINVGYERIWDCPIRGVYMDPAQTQYWRTEFTALF